MTKLIGFSGNSIGILKNMYMYLKINKMAQRHNFLLPDVEWVIIWPSLCP
jgi:hypothetical protein